MLKSNKKAEYKIIYIFEKGLDFCNLLWHCCVLTGGTTYEKYNQRVMARKHRTARGQQKQYQGNEGAYQLYSKAR